MTAIDIQKTLAAQMQQRFNYSEISVTKNASYTKDGVYTLKIDVPSLVACSDDGSTVLAWSTAVIITYDYYDDYIYEAAMYGNHTGLLEWIIDTLRRNYLYGDEQ